MPNYNWIDIFEIILEIGIVIAFIFTMQETISFCFANEVPISLDMYNFQILK